MRCAWPAGAVVVNLSAGRVQKRRIFAKPLQNFAKPRDALQMPASSDGFSVSLDEWENWREVLADEPGNV